MRTIAVVSTMFFVACGGGEKLPAIVTAPPAASSSASAPAPAASATDAEDCGDEYRPKAAWSGPKPDLAVPPELPPIPPKIGEAFSVGGAVHALRSRHQWSDVTRAEISIVGYIVDSNIPRAPKCAWHKTGVRDPADCQAEMPSFIIADKKDANPKVGPAIKVLGWAANWARVYEANQRYKGLTSPPKELYKDDLWNVDVPYPLPANGMKVKVTGRYGFTFTKSSTGVVADPKNGVLTYSKMEVMP